MDQASASDFYRLVATDARIALQCLSYALPFVLVGWLISRLKPRTKSLVSELGREEETGSWDRERRRRYGRHQHRHGRHHRRPAEPTLPHSA